MTSKFTNITGISLSMAVWLSEDLYDHNDDPNTISVTTLIKPLKSILLSMRVPPSSQPVDVSTLVASRVGTDIHTGVENAWLNSYASSMLALGFPQSVIDLIAVNPTQADLDLAEEDDVEIIPVYMELRSSRKVGKYTVSGKFDFVADGILEDVKSTGTYTYIKRSKDLDYKLQGSMYKWLNPSIITEDVMQIQYVFTDWKAGDAMRDKKYPPAKQMAYPIKLMSDQETNSFVEAKVRAIDEGMDKPESEMPMCTPEELWRDAPVFKYYKNPLKMSRSTKNFDTIQAANIRLIEDKSVGVVVQVPGMVKACKYCNAITVCEQAKSYVADGSLKI